MWKKLAGEHCLAMQVTRFVDSAMPRFSGSSYRVCKGRSFPGLCPESLAPSCDGSVGPSHLFPAVRAPVLKYYSMRQCQLTIKVDA